MKRVVKVLAVGVAESKGIPGFAVLYQRIMGKPGPILRGDWVRVVPVPGSHEWLAYGPEDFRNRYRVIQEYRHDSPVDQEIPWRPVGACDGLLLGEEVGPGVRQVRRIR